MSTDSGSTPGWMLGNAEAVLDTAAALHTLAALVDTEDDRVTTSMGSTALALGWHGDLVDRGDQAAGSVSSLFSRVAGDLRAAAEALTGLGELLSSHGPQLTSLHQQVLDIATALLWSDLGTAGQQDAEAARDDLNQHRRLLAAELDDADRTCRDLLQSATVALQDLARPQVATGFLRSSVPSEVWSVFRDRGLVDSDLEQSLAEVALACTTSAELWALLAEVDADRLDGFLRRNPTLAHRLTLDYHPQNPDDPALAGLYAAAGPLDLTGGSIAVDPARIADIASYWQGLRPDERTRLRAYYPALIGNLDGIPVPHRAAANSWLVDAARDQAEAEVAQLLDGGDPRRLAAAQERLALFTQLSPPGDTGRTVPVLDGGRVILPAGAPAVLAFDTRADGRFAQWHGPFGASNVAVYVPGTGTDLGSISTVDALMRRLVTEPDTAGISWLGTDLPDTVPAAAWTRYSEDGGESLLRFTEGLGLADDQSLTAIGYSAGGGIVAWADMIGAKFDRTMLLAPSGAAVGLPLNTPGSYPVAAWDGSAREVQRFTQTAPGDLIVLAQRSNDARALLGFGGLTGIGVGLFGGLGHGSDPNTHDQIIRVETGRFCEPDEQQPCGGTRVGEVNPHSAVTWPDSDAWHNTVGVVTGGTVLPYRSQVIGDLFWIIPVHENVYVNDAYPGTNPVPIEAVTPTGVLWGPMLGHLVKDLAS